MRGRAKRHGAKPRWLEMSEFQRSRRSLGNRNTRIAPPRLCLEPDRGNNRAGVRAGQSSGGGIRVAPRQKGELRRVAIVPDRKEVRRIKLRFCFVDSVAA
jgi:hypothetical protein